MSDKISREDIQWFFIEVTENTRHDTYIEASASSMQPIVDYIDQLESDLHACQCHGIEVVNRHTEERQRLERELAEANSIIESQDLTIAAMVKDIDELQSKMDDSGLKGAEEMSDVWMSLLGYEEESWKIDAMKEFQQRQEKQND